MAVNYIDPPYLPFCEGDDDRTIDYARTFLASCAPIRTNADKQIGLIVLVSLGKVHPKELCARSSK